MSIEINYDQSVPILRIITSGQLDYDEFSFFMETIVNSKDYPANINTIWDLRKGEFSSVDNNFWENLINQRMRFPQRDNSRSALIVESSFQYGMSRMFQNQVGERIPQKFMVFRDYDAGEKWLLESHEE